MAVCMERKPPGKVFANKEEAVCSVEQEYRVHKARENLAKELLYQTIRDALAYTKNNANRFKPFRGKIRNGTGRFDPEAARKKAYEDIQAWVNSDDFGNLTTRLRIDTEQARKSVMDVLNGQNVEDVEKYVDKLLHARRKDERRGPKPREQ